MSNGFDRRHFFKVVGVASAAGAAACTPRVEEKIIPHVVPPEDQIPGEALWYSSICLECAAGCGIMVKNREGRALKIEGNPRHPISQGGVCARGHSALQATYHPDRFRAPLKQGKQVSWDEALAAAAAALAGGKAAVLTGALPASALADVLDALASATGNARVVWEPFQNDPLLKAAEVVLGTAAIPAYDFDKAGYIFSFGADILETWLNPVANTKRFTKSHGYHNGTMAKFVQVDPRLSNSAAKADEWLQAKPGSELQLALALLDALLAAGAGADAAENAAIRAWIGNLDRQAVAKETGIAIDVVDRLAKEMMAYGPVLVVAGGAANQYSNATALHTAALLINRVLGSVGVTVHAGLGARNDASVGGTAAFEALLDRIHAGEIDTLVVYKTDPVFTAPSAWKVREAFAKLDALIVLDALPSETAALATLVLPDHAPLEQWGDHRGYNGVHGLAQPAMNPLFETRHAGDTAMALLAALGHSLPAASFKELVQAGFANWQDAQLQGGEFSADVAAPPARLGDLSSVPITAAAQVGDGDLTLVAYPHIYRYDGRYANRGWMQEIPDPMVHSVWSNWVEIHPVTAKRLGLVRGDRVRISSAAGAIETYVYVTAAIVPEAVAVPLGQGHSDAIGRFGNDIPGNPFTLLGATRDDVTGAWVLGGTKVKLSKVASFEPEFITGIDRNLVTTNGSNTDLGRGITQVVALSEIAKIDAGEMEPPHVAHHGTKVLDENGFYPPHEHPKHRWGMVIDTHACTGCNACVAACYSENNIPVVGKDLVASGREMSWIRIERYFDGDEANGDARFVPMLCQHCNNAPCEPVCPVIATYHTVDGLNGMVYNRCVGTRYCGNNCTYKVRRFNYFGYDDPKQKQFAWPEPMDLMLNPDVSVRSKGVMEKCTFCVQRIRRAEETAKFENRPLVDGEFTTACAESCPADAIIFGDLLDPNSRVAKAAKHTHRGYKLLEVLNTQPAVTYLKNVRWTGDKA